MIKLFQQGSGSSQCEIVKPALTPEQWTRLKNTAIRLLRARGRQKAADILETENFGLYEATNDWQDDFAALHKQVSVEEYAEYGEKHAQEDYRDGCREMALVFTELGQYIRFVAVELSMDDDVVVSPELPPTTPEAVRLALTNVEHLMSTQGPVSAIDRVHTAIHGYLKALCDASGLTPVSPDPSVNALLKQLVQHPKFKTSPAYSEKIERILRAFATVLDSMNTLRNHASLAHPNEKLLDEADAMLVVNAARTILRYISDRFK
jgi:hypothetical protein